MNIELTNCPLCNSGQFNLYLKTKDFSVSQEEFKIVECNNCNFRFTNPRPDEESTGAYYESENYISHTNKSNNLLNSVYKIARIFTIQDKSKLLKKWAKKGSLLDIGCGTGEFLDYNKQLGWRVNGVEVNEQARKQAEGKLNQSLFKKVEEVPEDKKFQAITLWHVLEHVADLEKTCRKIINLLDANGTLIVAVPNCESYDAAYYREYWAAYDVPRHLSHFTKASMGQLWNKLGLNVQAVLPMKLDAYYVSLLSEKYKNGNSNVLSAGRVGWTSNFKAKKEINYSSLIYIIRK